MWRECSRITYTYLTISCKLNGMCSKRKVRVGLKPLDTPQATDAQAALQILVGTPRLSVLQGSGKNITNMNRHANLRLLSPPLLDICVLGILENATLTR